MRSVVATVVFLIVTIVLSLASVPAALLDRSGKSYLWLARAWSWIFLKLYGIEVEVIGTEHIDRSRNYVYVANHASYTDIPVVLASIPDNIRLILRQSLTRIPIWGWALLVSPFLIIDRSSASRAKETIDHAARTIRNGASVLLFPEGTRTSNGKLQPFTRGAFKLAADSGAAVLPLALRGTYEVLPRSRTLPASSKKVSLEIGRPILSNDTLQSSREREMDLMRRSEAAIREMLHTQG